MTSERKTGNAQAFQIMESVMKSTKDKLKASSNQLEDFQEIQGDILHPPYEPRDLLKVVEESSFLKQYIKAMSTNIAKFGHEISYRDDFDYNDADSSAKKQADIEWDKLKRLYEYINPTEAFKKIIEKMVIDRESIGWGAIEVIRDGKGDVAQMEYCKAANVRICKDARANVEYKVWEVDETNNYIQRTRFKKFRKFVQIVNGTKVYFKEFGDPRNMDCRTGEYKDGLTEENIATEIALFEIHDPSSEYGIPRWTGSIADILGSRASEVLNFAYFESGTIIPAAIIVDGGQLTEDSVEAIKAGKGVDNAFKLLLLETAPFEDEDSAGGESPKNKVTTRIEKLADITNKESLFQEYQKNTKEKLRDNFRLPPIFTGESSDYNRATAETARQIAEEQIFAPEREDIMSIINTIVNNELGIRYIEVKLKGPITSNVAEKSAALAPYIQAGAVTPNMLIESLEELLGKQIEPFPGDIGNMPIEILKLKEMQSQMSEEDGSSIEKSDTINILQDMLGDIRGYLNGQG